MFRTHRWLLSAAVAVLLPAASGLVACGEPDAAKAPAAVKAPTVTVVRVSSTDVTPNSTFSARVEAIDTVDLRARVQGFVERRLFQEGADVKAGDLLFELEKAPYLAEVDRINAAIARAAATLKLASIDVDRQEELVRRQVKAQSTLDESRAKEAESRADLQREQASLRQAELNLGYTDIRAPISGRVGRAAYSVGDFVEPSSGTLATIVSQDPIHVTFPVTQRELLQFRRNAEAHGADPRTVRVRVRLADNSFYPHEGALDFVDVKADQGTDTIAVRARLPNPDRVLVDGQLVTAVVEAPKTESVLVIPVGALQIDQGGRFVLVVDEESKVQVRRVTTGRSYDDKLVVTGGLQGGERVIVTGVQKVRPQQTVQVTEAAGAPGS